MGNDKIEHIKDNTAKNANRIIKSMTEERLRELKENIARLKLELGEATLYYPIKIDPSNMTNLDIHRFSCGIFEQDKSHRCDGCIFLDTYHDMGMSCDVCSLIHGLDKAVEATKCKATCPNKLTMEEAHKYVKNRNNKKLEE